ncbi:RloB domain-containing protein [Polymorphobacter sp.]|uniref:RloB domain-containing protein n=1 Tax=Polymorphobacter sp. TaxID=1909290 RepID=UPI003F71DAC8
MSRRRPFRPQRVPIFIGCEGESERGYVAFLSRLVEEAGLAVHLDPVVLQPGGGDPLAIVERARKRLSEGRRKQTAYAAKFVMLDRDKLGQAPARDAQVAAVAAGAGLSLIWQDPCHEAMLLRHLEACATLRPRTTPLAESALIQRWPAYSKPMDGAGLSRRLDHAALLRAIAVEPELALMVKAIGLDT